MVHELSEQERILALLKTQSGSQESTDTEGSALLDYLKAGTSTSPPEDLVKALLPPTRRATGADWAEARHEARHWQEVGISVGEVAAWLKAGVEPDEALLADELIEEGISPQRATLVVEDPDMGDRLTIVELVRRHHSPLRPGAVSEILDAALVERQRLNRGPQWMRHRWGRRA
jgi:hypothetical protein